MADEQPTTGTPTQDGGDAASQPTAGTPELEGRDAVSDEPDWREIALANRATVEKANQALRALQEQQPRATSPAGSGEFRPDAYRDYLQGVKQEAEKIGNTGMILWANKELVDMDTKDRLVNENRLMQETLRMMVRVPQDEQREIFKELQANPDKYNSLEDAQREVNLRKQQAEVSRLQQEIKRLQNQNAVPTAGREVQAVPEFKKEMTGAEWKARQASLSRDQAYAEQAKLRRGEIKVVW